MNKRLLPFRVSLLILVVGFFVLHPARLLSQQVSPPRAGLPHAHSQDGIYIVFPFENVGASARLDWIGEGLEELTIQWLSNTGQSVYSHEGRLNEMDRYGLPSTAKLSRATMLHVAQELDADYIVFGNFSSDGNTLTVTARIMRVDPVGLLPVVRESDALETLMDLQSKVIWKLLTTLDHNYYLSFSEFNKRRRQLRLDAFEQYIHGLLATEDEPRIRYLKEAARLEPDWPEPAYALGEVYYARNDCAAALPWFARIPTTHDRSVEAVFATGVCQWRMNHPEKAEQLLAGLQSSLQNSTVSGADLPEILNNLALAQARQGNMAAALTTLGRARDIDPDEDDYPFNLGLLALRQSEWVTASTHFAEAVHREPDNAEDFAFLIYSLDKAGKKADAEQQRVLSVEEFGDKGLPALKLDGKPDSLNRYERIKPELDISTLRLDFQVPRVQHLTNASTTSPAKDSPAQFIRHGRQEMNAGRLDAAEQEFRAALAADPKNASGHRELAEIYRRRGRLDEAVQELKSSLASRDSAAVRVVLARIYLEQKKPNLARSEVEKAVKLAPNYPDAKELLDHLDKGKSTGGAK
jgi:Tfp pilus assembly protein PilF/TolB-like protein